MEDNARSVGHIWIPMSGATAMSSRRIRNKKSAGAKSASALVPIEMEKMTMELYRIVFDLSRRCSGG